MKRVFYSLILFPLIYLTSCSKEAIPAAEKSNGSDNNPSIKSTTSLTKGNTTSPDSIMDITGYIKLALENDDSGSNTIVLYFTPKSKSYYVPGEDAPFIPGFGLASLSSTSSDNVALSLNLLPLRSKGDTISLNVGAKNDGIYRLDMSAINAIPEKFNVWLMDGYKKDSLDLRQNQSYSFNIYTADTSSFGKNRFKLILH